nr:MAG TPA: hypothetical protein [Caudoviricetes sp.]
MQMSSEKTLIRCRDKLIENRLFEYEKGTKSKPNRYKISTVNFTVKTTVNMTVDMGVDVSNINRLDKDIYINLFNKYTAQISGGTFCNKIKAINTCKSEKDYELLSVEEQNRLFNALMSLK